MEARELGLRVSEDLNDCGSGDADFAAYLSPSTSTVRVNGAEIGRRVARLVLVRCHGEQVLDRVMDIGFRIIERESTGKAEG